MKSLPKFIPTAPEVLREAIIVMAGALIAVAIVKALPAHWQQWFNLSGGASNGQTSDAATRQEWPL